MGVEHFRSQATDSETRKWIKTWISYSVLSVSLMWSSKTLNILCLKSTINYVLFYVYYLTPSAHDQGQLHWFQCCSAVPRASAVESWPPEWLRQEGQEEALFYHPHFTGGRLKQKEGKKRQERKDVSDMFKATQQDCCRVRKLIHISHSTRFPLLSHTRSPLRAVRVYESMLLCMVVTKKSPRLHRCRRAGLLNQSSRERNSAWVSTHILLPRCKEGDRVGNWILSKENSKKLQSLMVDKLNLSNVAYKELELNEAA